MFAITLSVERRRAAVAPKSRLLGHTDGSRAAAIVVLSVLGVYCVRVCRRNRPHENVEDARDGGRGRERQTLCRGLVLGDNPGQSSTIFL
jgi:hypothetical protein